MPRLDHEGILEQLRSRGLRFRSVECRTEGDYQVADVDWNNKDVPHLNCIHTLVQDVTCVVDADLQASVSLQKVFGVPLPIVLVHYDSGPDRQTHFETLLAWTVVTDIRFERVTPTRTRTHTTYWVGANRIWMLFFPLIRMAIRRNYRRLMAEDVPMRERRGVLRGWGYTFRGDEKPTRDIRDSLPIGNDNVVPPTPDRLVVPLPERVARDRLVEGRAVLVGRSDHLGLKLVRHGDTVSAHRRSCPHEGADLDPVAVTDGCQTCPWHRRRLPALATLDLADGTTARTPWHTLTVVDGGVEVVVDRPDGR